MLASVANIKTVRAFFTGKVVKTVLVAAITEGALQALKEPFGIAPGAQEPSGPALLIKKSEICAPSAGRTVTTPPELMVK